MRRKRKLNKIIKILLFILIALGIYCFYEVVYLKKDQNDNEKVVDKKPEKEIPKKEDIYTDILINTVGDVTLGTYYNQGYDGTVPDYLKRNNNDYSYFFKKVVDVFSKDDFTIANLEGPFTDATVRKPEKVYAFKGPKEYTNILTKGSIESVTLANNHSHDYYDVGFNDTKAALDEAGVKHFGYDEFLIYEVKGIKIGLVGLEGFDEEESKLGIDKAKEYFDKNKVSAIIYIFHWGQELHNKNNELQTKIAHYAIDNGNASVVIGHHPHVLQGFETYNGVDIAYSLGNFCFGGKRNPKDKRTMILQINMSFKNEDLLESKFKIIPALISGLENSNNYQPVLSDGKKAESTYKLLKENSTNFSYGW